MGTHCGPHKGPWRIQYGDGDTEIEYIYGKRCNKFCDGEIVVADSGYYPPSRADAELIVKLVNEHYEREKHAKRTAKD